MLTRKYVLIQIGNARGNANGWKRERERERERAKSEKDRKERYSSELNGR